MYQESRRILCVLTNRLQAAGEHLLNLINALKVFGLLQGNKLQFHSGQRLRQVQQCQVLHFSNSLALVDRPSIVTQTTAGSSLALTTTWQKFSYQVNSPIN